MCSPSSALSLLLLLICVGSHFAESDSHFEYRRDITPKDEIGVSAGGNSEQEEIIVDGEPSTSLRGNSDPGDGNPRKLLSCILGTGQAAYVSPTGTDLASFGSDPSTPYKTLQYAVDNISRGPTACGVLYVMEGTYYNEKYGDGTNHYKAIVNLSGVTGINITNYREDTPLLKFDGPAGIVCSSSNPCSNIDISGLEIEGPSADITWDEAMSVRLDAPNRFLGRGIAVWKGDHISIRKMTVHHCSGSGIRVNKGDHLRVSDSVVHSNCWWSPRAESAVVFAEAKSTDQDNSTKMVITRNEVYGNINKIPYYNPNYAWDYSPIGGLDCSLHPACDPLSELLARDCPWQCRYGKASQDFIIDGSGVYVTRNQHTYFYGQMELSYNTCYGNGINGLVFHRTDRGIVKQNIIYDNGVVPMLTHPEPVVEKWHTGAAGKSRQPYSGLVLNNAAKVKLWSNTVSSRYEDDFAFKQHSRSGMPDPVKAGGNNKACRGKVTPSLLDEGIVKISTGMPICIIPSATPSIDSLTDSPQLMPSMPMQPTLRPSNAPSISPTEAPLEALAADSDRSVCWTLSSWQCGPGRPCGSGACCSQWGWCGKSKEHCDSCCQSNCGRRLRGK